ncbi:MAG: NADPH-dependent FMN reductase [Pseudomonadota bacterium]
MVKLLGISGSLRRESFNTKLVREAARAFGEAEFALADLNLPLFNEDVEAEGVPAPVTVLMDQIAAADAIVLCTPEYNKAPPGVLKNALDWVSRRKPMPTMGKPVAVLSATAGLAGGERSTAALYLMLVPFGVKMVFQPEVFVGRAGTKFGEDGRLSDEATFGFVEKKMAALREAIG